MLERTRDAARREALRREAGHIFAVEADHAFVGDVRAAQQIEERRFAGAIRTDHANAFATRDRETHIRHGRDAIETARHAPHVEENVGRCPGRMIHCRLHHTVPNRPCGRKRTSNSRTMP